MNTELVLQRDLSLDQHPAAVYLTRLAEGSRRAPAGDQHRQARRSPSPQVSPPARGSDRETTSEFGPSGPAGQGRIRESGGTRPEWAGGTGGGEGEGLLQNCALGALRG